MVTFSATQQVLNVIQVSLHVRHVSACGADQRQLRPTAGNGGCHINSHMLSLYNRAGTEPAVHKDALNE